MKRVAGMLGCYQLPTRAQRSLQAVQSSLIDFYSQDDNQCLFSCSEDKDESLRAPVMVISFTVQVVG